MHFSGAAYTPKRKKKSYQYFKPKSSKAKSSTSPEKVSPGPASPGTPADPTSPEDVPGYAKPQRRNFSRSKTAEMIPNHRPDLDACLSYGGAVDERGKRKKQKAERRAHARTLRMRDGRANGRTAGAAIGSPKRPGTAPATFGGMGVSSPGAAAADTIGAAAVPSKSAGKEFVPIVGQAMSPSKRPSGGRGRPNSAGARGHSTDGVASATARTADVDVGTPDVAVSPPLVNPPSPVTYIPTSASPPRGTSVS